MTKMAQSLSHRIHDQLIIQTDFNLLQFLHILSNIRNSIRKDLLNLVPSFDLLLKEGFQFLYLIIVVVKESKGYKKSYSFDIVQIIWSTHQTDQKSVPFAKGKEILKLLNDSFAVFLQESFDYSRIKDLDGVILLESLDYMVTTSGYKVRIFRVYVVYVTFLMHIE